MSNSFNDLLATIAGGTLSILSFFVAVATFFGCWFYAYATWGLLLGLAFGWIPALIIAVMAYFLAVIVIPLIILIALYQWLK